MVPPTDEMALAGPGTWDEDIGGMGNAADECDGERTVTGFEEAPVTPVEEDSPGCGVTMSSASARRVEPRVPRSQRGGGLLAGALNHPLGFNCPACAVILVIRQPENYDGSAAPCPHCGVQILPPRIVYSTASFDLHPLPGLSFSSGWRARAPRAIPRLERRGRVTWRGGSSAEAR
jgi:hypothetical protein